MGFFDPTSPSHHTLSWFFPNPLPLCHSLKSDKLWQIFSYIWLLKQFYLSVGFHIETSHLICSAYQMISFYMLVSI